MVEVLWRGREMFKCAYCSVKYGGPQGSLRIISQHISNYLVRISNYAQHIPNSSEHILNSLQILKSSQHISKSSQHISKSLQHISKSPQHIFEIFTTHSPQDPKCWQRKGNGSAASSPSFDAMFCSTSRESLQVSFKCCPKCGKELAQNVVHGSCDVDSLKNIIETYFLAGFEYDTNVGFVEKFHSIHISLSTLKRRLRDCGLKRRNSADLNQNGVREDNQRIGWPKLHVWVPGYVAYTSPQIWPLYSQKYSAKSTEETGRRRHRRT